MEAGPSVGRPALTLMPFREERAAKLSKAIEDLLNAVGKSPGNNPELIETPVRTASLWLDDVVDGYEWNPSDILSGGSEAPVDSEMVVIRNLSFHSICPHHLVLYQGVANVGYIPGERVASSSKIARLVDCFAHRLILQTAIGRNVSESLVEYLGAKGAACMLDAEQLCMVIRGVRDPGSRIVTASYSGVMSTDPNAKSHFLAAVNAEA